MTTLPTPNGFTGNMFFEPLLRQFIAYQLKQLTLNVNDPNVTFVDELFGRMGDDVRLQVKKWLASHPKFNVEINFPREDSQLPFVAVVHAEDSEKSNEAYLGDDGGTLYIGASSVTASSQLKLPPNVYGQQLNEVDNRPRALQARQLISVPETRTTRLYIGTEDVNTTLYLYTIVKALLLVNKLDFDKYAGARNMKFSGSDFDHNKDLFPQFAYVKVLTLSYDANFDIPLSPTGTIGGVDVSFTANGVMVSEQLSGYTGQETIFYTATGSEGSDFFITLTKPRLSDNYGVLGGCLQVAFIVGMMFPDSADSDRTKTQFRVITTASLVAGDLLRFEVIP